MPFITQKDKERQDISGAMTDISFLLIIFFLIAMVFVTDEGLALFLPDKYARPEQKDSTSIIPITILTDDIVQVAGQETAVTGLTQALLPLSVNNTDLVAIIDVAEDIQYGLVIEILSLVRAAGISRFTVRDQSVEELLLPLRISQ